MNLKPALSWGVALPLWLGCALVLEAQVVREVSQPAQLRLKTGQVLFNRPPAAPVPAPVPQSLEFGDRIETAELSWALVEFPDANYYKVPELTDLRIVRHLTAGGRLSARLQKGGAYFVSNRKGRIQGEVQIPGAVIKPSGTEFLIEVRDGWSRVVMFDGEAEIEAGQGRAWVRSGEEGVLEAGQAPRVARIEARSLVQWWLYYPAVLDPGELELAPEESEALGTSLEAYRQGDLLEALRRFPGYPRTAEAALGSDGVRVYYAALVLSVGSVNRAEAALQGVGRESGLRDALKRLIAAVTGEPADAWIEPASASAWLARSYEEQARQNLEAARMAARMATQHAPEFGFAWARLAELEFSFGQIGAAREALDRALELAPRNAQAHALMGFLRAAENQMKPAMASFEEAIRLDPALGNAWLGRGLIRIRENRMREGIEDLQTAVILEPARSLVHSYLGKAFQEQGQSEAAGKELDLAKRLDANDPTPWFYAALQKIQDNRVNEAIADLEAAQARNANRAVYRSSYLLDQDAAVRGANLALLYEDAGMAEFGAREAARAVNLDYANYSAHLFLANSYNALRDPAQINLRYETAWLSEYLVANLLAPVGAVSLSPQVSQQEYSRLFERDRLGLSSYTEYRSSGDWIQSIVQHGVIGNSSYAAEVAYRSDDGDRPNEDLEQFTTTFRWKQQVGPRDSLYAQASYYEAETGDVTPYYDNTRFNPGLRTRETQEPAVIAGAHHQWSPGVDTLFLAGFIEDTYRVDNSRQGVLMLEESVSGGLLSAVPLSIGQEYRSDALVYSAEIQQILERNRHTWIAGARAQQGNLEAQNDPGVSGSTFLYGHPLEAFDDSNQKVDETFTRWNAYGYLHFQPVESLVLVAGVSYDHLEYPEGFRYAPLSEGNTTAEQWSPKAGVIWTPWKGGTVRGAYSRFLGGVAFDQSIRLEPTQVAGFNQAYRSLIPEAVAGANAAEEMEVLGVALDQKLASRTYLGITAERLRSELQRVLGVYSDTSTGLVVFAPPPYILPSSTPQALDYQEETVVANVHQLLGDEWALGAQYRVSRAEYEESFPEIPTGTPTVPGYSLTQDVTAILHQVRFYLLFNHPTGWFTQFDSVWSQQSNRGYEPDQPGDDFWQFNFWTGCRFARRKVEVRAGLLNLSDQDYQWNPLNLTPTLPRERTGVLSLRLNF